MAKVTLDKIVAHCNRILKPKSFEDWPGAVNGLQVQNSGSVSRIAAALPTKEVPSRLATSARLLTVIRSNGVRMEVDDEWDVGGG